MFLIYLAHRCTANERESAGGGVAYDGGTAAAILETTP